MEIEKMNTLMESLLLKTVREMNEAMARLQNAISLPSPLWEVLESNRKQQEMLDSFSRLSMLGKLH